MDITKTITHISLCAGYGGIDIGLRRAIPSLRTIAFSEIECFACANLVSKMEAGLLDASPIWTDVKTFPWEEFSGRVDILSGGYPCQPFSSAGKRLGTDDSRHLWPFIANGIRILQPQFCFFENVEGHITLGLREVISELESMGYKVSWGIFSAREVGAPHQRKRVFILAMANSTSDRFAGGLLNGETLKQTQGNTIKGSSSWPSRPNQPQYAFEPPRVVGNAKEQGLSRPNNGQKKSGNRESGGYFIGSSEVMGDSPTEGLQRPRVSGEMDSKSRGAEGKGSELAPASAITGDAQRGEGSDMANTRSVCGERPDPDRVCGREICESTWGSEVRSEDCRCGESDGGTGELGNAASERSCGRCKDRGGEQPKVFRQGFECTQDQRKTQPPLGRDTDGTTRWMDYAELSVSCDNRTDSGTSSECGRELADSIDNGCNNADSQLIEHGVKGSLGEETAQQTKRDRIYCSEHGQTFGNGQLHPDLYITCDNRTDELRLLGNGVVPATATLAFQTLLAELLYTQPNL